MKGKVLPPPAPPVPESGFRKLWGNRHFHDTLTVCVSYGVTILFLKLRPSEQIQWKDGPPSSAMTLGILALFTASHGVGASFVYGLFVKDALKRCDPGPMGVLRAIGCFVLGHMAFWYGAPTAGLVAMTWTPAPLLAIVHVALSPGTRLWRCLAYGAAFFSLLLLVMMTGGLGAHTPMWLLAAAVALQIALLRLQGRFIAKLFLRP